MRGCEPLSSLEYTRNRQEIMNILCIGKWARTCLEICKGIRGHQGWYLTPRDFINLDVKKSYILRFSRFCQNRGGNISYALGLRTWGGHSWNLRRKPCWSESRMLQLDTIWMLKLMEDAPWFLKLVTWRRVRRTISLQRRLSHGACFPRYQSSAVQIMLCELWFWAKVYT